MFLDDMSHDSEFLSHHAPFEEQERLGRRHRLTVCLLVAAIFVGGLAVWSAVNAGLSVAAIFDGRDRLFEAKAAVENLAFDQAKESLILAEADFSQARKYLHRLGWMKIFPWFGPQISAAETTLEVSTDLFSLVGRLADLGAEIMRLTGEIETLTEDGESLLSFNYNAMTPAAKRLVLQRLNGAAPDLLLLAEQVGLIVEQLKDIKDTPDPMGAIVRRFDETLSPAGRVLKLTATAARLLPSFAGLAGEKKFLLLLENNTELRPAGGFIGTYGILRVGDGEIIELKLNDSYLLDAAADPFYSLEPPAPLKKYLSADEWYFRDSNWSPDFSVSARNAISLFTNEVLAIPSEQRGAIQEPVSFDGVIAITPTFVSDLLAATGPIIVSGQTFSAENIVDTLEYQVEVGFQEDGTPYNQRKEIIAVLLNEIKTKLFDLPFVSWGPAASAIEKNLIAKQIVLFSNSSLEAEEVVREAGWGGVIENYESDFLMVVDANLASLKTDPQVLRSISYTIEPIEDRRFLGRATIRYDHQGGFDWKTTRYRTYTRLYVPLGSQFIRATGMLADDKLKNPSGAAGTIDVGQELGLAVFGAFISIEPGESGELSFEYYLPESVGVMIDSGKYSLAVNKQIGAAEHSLTTELNFGKKVKSAYPAELQIFWGDQTYSGSFGLDRDLSISVNLD